MRCFWLLDLACNSDCKKQAMSNKPLNNNSELTPGLEWACGFDDHLHTSWEAADECARTTPLVRQLRLETIRMAWSWLELVNEMRNAFPETEQALDESRDRLYKSLKLEYELAGAPLGIGEEAMRQWFHQLMVCR